MTCDRSQVVCYRQMWPALHLGDEGLDAGLVDIDHGNARAGGGEGEADLAADAARPSGDNDAFAFQP